MGEKVRAILREAVKEAARPGGSLGSDIAALLHGPRLRDSEEMPELRGHMIKPVESD